MQHLLDFIHEHTLEERLYLVAATPQGELEMTWERSPGADDMWLIRPRGSQISPVYIHAGDLLDYVEALGADMRAIEGELQALVMTQIAFADVVLRDAREVLGYEVVQQVVAGHRSFALQLKATIESLTGPARRFELVEGGAAQTPASTGHLTLVR